MNITTQTASPVDNAEKTAALLKLIAHPHRLVILCLLAQSERSATEIAGVIGITQTAVSNHLARLRAKGVVDYTRYHRILQYRITSPEIANLLQAVCRLDGESGPETES